MDKDFAKRKFKTGYGVPSQNEQDSRMIFEETGALLEGHFIYTSGNHGAVYVNKDAVYPWTQKISRMCQYIAMEYCSSNIEVVAGPALGGIILSQWVAYHLTSITGRDVFAVYAEKINGRLRFKRGYDQIIANKRVLIVEDIITTGGSVQQVVNIVKSLNGNIRGVYALWNRGHVNADSLNVDNCGAILREKFPTWTTDECPLCTAKIPINNNVGKGKK